MVKAKIAAFVAAVVVAACVTQRAPAQQIPALHPADFTQKEFYEQALVFHRKDLVEAYQSGGKHDPRWDAAALIALNQYALFCAQDQTDDVAFPALYPGKKVTYEEIEQSTQKAIDAGCTDPMIAYAHGMAERNLGLTAAAREFMNKAAKEIAGYPYSAYRRFKVLERAREFAAHTIAEDNAWPAVEKACIAMAQGPFQNAVAHREIALALFQAYVSRPHEDFEADLARLAAAPGVDRWVYLHAMVEMQIDLAWDARGAGWAADVTAEGWRGFNEHLAKAATAAEEAWKLHPEFPEPASAMVRVSMGAGTRADEFKWFNRAIAGQGDFTRAYSSILQALQPRWGGTNEDMLAVGKQAGAVARFDTAIPWEFFHAAVLVRLDDHGGDVDIFKKPEVQQTAARILDGYMKRWKGQPQERCFQSALAALRSAADDMPGARKAFDAMTGDPDGAPFNYFGLWLSTDLEKVYLDTFSDQAAVKKFRTAVSRANFQNAIADIDSLLAADKPTGRDRQIIDAYRQGCQLMEGYRNGAAVEFTSASSLPFWYVKHAGTFVDDALVNRGVDNQILLTGHFYLPDRHYELHLAFQYTDTSLDQDAEVYLTWGRGTGGRQWFFGMVAQPPKAAMQAPGIEDSKDFPISDSDHHTIDIVYWGGVPQVTIDGKAASYSFADAKAVQGLSKQNTLEFYAKGPVRITRMSLKHLNTKPAGANADEDLP